MLTSAQRWSFREIAFMRLSEPAVQRATAAIPPVIPLSISISTSIPTPYTGIRLPTVFDMCVAGVITSPIAPRDHWTGGAVLVLVLARKGLSSLSACLRGRSNPSHSHSQHSRLRSSSVQLTLSPAAAVRVSLFKTFGTIPVSEVGDTADVASACDRAWCSELCIA